MLHLQGPRCEEQMAVKMDKDFTSEGVLVSAVSPVADCDVGASY